MKKSIKLSLTILTTLTLFACSGEIKSSQIVTDMPLSDLVDTMGEPDYIEDDSDVMYKEVKPIWVMLVKMEQEAKATNIKELSLDEQKRYETLAKSLKEMGNVMNAIGGGNELERYDYLDEKVESADGEVDKTDIEVYVLNGRVIYKRYVASSE